MNYSKIKEATSLKNLSIEDLCSRIGMSTTGFHQAVKNDSLKVRTLEEIAKVLQMPMGYFFEEKGDNAVNQTAGNGGVNLAHSKNRDIHTRHSDEPGKKKDAELDVCLERVKGLEREIELLREMNDMLKKK